MQGKQRSGPPFMGRDDPGRSNAECKLSKGWPRNYREKKLLQNRSPNYREIIQHPGAPLSSKELCDPWISVHLRARPHSPPPKISWRTLVHILANEKVSSPTEVQGRERSYLLMAMSWEGISSKDSWEQGSFAGTTSGGSQECLKSLEFSLCSGGSQECLKSLGFSLCSSTSPDILEAEFLESPDMDTLKTTLYRANGRRGFGVQTAADLRW